MLPGPDKFEEYGSYVEENKLTRSQFIRRSRSERSRMEGSPLTKIHSRYLHIEKKRAEEEYEELYCEFETLVSRYKANAAFNPSILPTKELQCYEQYKEFKFVNFDTELYIDHIIALEEYIKSLNKEIFLLSNIIVEFKPKLFAFISNSMKEYSKKHNIEHALPEVIRHS
jgi:hypothetical protein